MVIGDTPPIKLQVIVRSYPSTMYAGDPILTVTLLPEMTPDCGMHCPLSMIGSSVRTWQTVYKSCFTSYVHL